MKAFTITEPFNAGIRSKRKPSPQEGEAVLKTLYAGICGSDIAAFKGEQPFVTYPRIPGHEGVYEVVDINGRTKSLSEGDIVTVEPYFNCGKCYPCLHGKQNCCVENRTMGVHCDGVMAEYFTVPVTKIYKVARRGIIDPVMSLVEPLGVALHAVKHAELLKHDNILIIGAGPIGLCIAVLCSYYGVEVMISDIDSCRLDLASRLNLEHSFIAGNKNGMDFVQRKTGKAGCDAVFEVTGTPEGFMSSIEMVASSGRIVLVGNGKREVNFCHSVLLKKELKVMGSRNSHNCFSEIIELLTHHKINVAPIITHIIDFKNMKHAFEMTSNKQGMMGKVLIKYF